MHEDKLRPSRWPKTLMTLWLVIALGPVVPLLVVLVILKLWELAWPLIVIVVVGLLVVGVYRLVRAGWWRWF